MCWYNFVGETGSGLIDKSTRVFLDAIELGGNPAKIGEIVSKSSLEIVLLRRKRNLVSKGFVNLVIPLHAAMCGVLIFIYRVMFSFSNSVSEIMTEHSAEVGGAAGMISPRISIFNIGGLADMPLIANLVTFVLLVLTLASAFASKFASGGSNYKLCFYTSVLSFVSAIIIFVVPIMVDKIFTL
jgi:flagellar protein FlaJ